MATPQDPLVGQVLADRFEILSRIGEGGIGVVYKAKQLAVDRNIAIKILGAHVSTDQSWVKRFHNEARAAARLDHPNTVRLIDFGQTKEGLLFIAMEFLHGRSLAEEIARIGRIPAQRMLRILQQICGSLQEAHSQGIIHRDIKPDNVFLVDTKGAGDFVKVLDFSVAKMDTPDAQATRAGTVFGTPAYMSPEQGRGVKLSPQSDLYACGIVAYEMLTGKPPFDARLPMEVVMMHLRQKPPPLVGFPDPIVTLVMKALEKTPERRQQSAQELDQECQACLDSLYPRQSSSLPVVGPGGGSGALPVSTPVSQPPPAGDPASVPVVPRTAAPEQRTMMAQPAPNLGNLANANGPGTGTQQQPANRTMAISGPSFNQGFNQGANQGDGMGTAYMPEGMVPVISQQGLAARQMALLPPPPRQEPASALFWLGWALLGISIGLALHFFMSHAG